MTPAELVDALALPDTARLDRRVPKRELLDRAPTAVDRRLIQEGVEELTWLAILKPSTIAVPQYRDASREYLEIPVLTAVLRSGARTARVTELVHRAIPYPVVLLAQDQPGTELSLANKRWSEAESGKTVVEAVETTGVLTNPASDVESAFAASLPLRLQPARDLFTVYQGWMDCVATLAAARVTGRFALSQTPEHATARRGALREHAALIRQIADVRASADRETQISRRAEMNLELQALRTRLAEVIELL